MTERPGMTCVPMIYTDAEGIEHLDYSHSQVVDHGKRLEVQAEALEQQSQYFSKDVEGVVSHEWDLGEYGDDEFVNSIYNDDAEDEYVEDDEFDVASFVFENIVSEEDYDTVIDWAAGQLPEHAIAQYDNIIENGDEEEIEYAVSKLIDLYNENN